MTYHKHLVVFWCNFFDNLNKKDVVIGEQGLVFKFGTTNDKKKAGDKLTLYRIFLIVNKSPQKGSLRTLLVNLLLTTIIFF